MGRGDDKQIPNPAPPKRNPFRQEIGEAGPVNSDSTGGENQGQVTQETKPSENKIASQEAARVTEAIRQAADSHYNGVNFNLKIRDNEDPAELKILLDEATAKLSIELSEKLANLAGDDLLLAEKLENVLQQSESSLFAQHSYNNNWQRVFSREGLDRLTRNIERTWVLHKTGLNQ